MPGMEPEFVPALIALVSALVGQVVVLVALWLRGRVEANARREEAFREICSSSMQGLEDWLNSLLNTKFETCSPAEIRALGVPLGHAGPPRPPNAAFLGWPAASAEELNAEWSKELP